MFRLKTNGQVEVFTTPKALQRALKALPQDQAIVVTHEARRFVGTPKKAFRNNRKAKKAGYDVPNLWAILLKGRS